MPDLDFRARTDFSVTIISFTPRKKIKKILNFLRVILICLRNFNYSSTFLFDPWKCLEKIRLYRLFCFERFCLLFCILYFTVFCVVFFAPQVSRERTIWWDQEELKAIPWGCPHGTSQHISRRLKHLSLGMPKASPSSSTKYNVISSETIFLIQSHITLVGKRLFVAHFFLNSVAHGGCTTKSSPQKC